MRTKSLITASILLFSVSAMAIRHVGNGGGEAELKLQLMLPNMSIWAQACNQNSDLCWSGGNIPTPVIESLPNLTLSFGAESKCLNQQVHLNNEELYLADGVTPKSDFELATILLKNIYLCVSHLYPTEDLEVKLLPLAWKVHTDVFTLAGKTTDVLTSPSLNYSLHENLVSQINCANYRLSAINDDSFQVRCENSKAAYRIFIRMTEQGLELISRYDSGEDF